MAVHGGLVGQCAVVFVKGHGVDLLIGKHAALECVCVGRGGGEFGTHAWRDGITMNFY